MSDDDGDDDDACLFFLFANVCLEFFVYLMNFLCCVIIITMSIVSLSLSLSKLLELLLEPLFFARFFSFFLFSVFCEKSAAGCLNFVVK